MMIMWSVDEWRLSSLTVRLTPIHVHSEPAINAKLNYLLAIVLPFSWHLQALIYRNYTTINHSYLEKRRKKNGLIA